MVTGPNQPDPKRLNIAVVGSGISGMSAAWLLSPKHDVTVYEQENRLGGHSNTLEAPTKSGHTLPVDTGFIVYNDTNYPNLVALFEHLKVPTKASEMSFAVSIDDGALEYGTMTMGQLFAQRRNLVRPRFWSMLRDLMRFYREAPTFRENGDEVTSLGAYLDRGNYGRPFRDDHLLPMAAAIWSTPSGRIGDYPAEAMIRFCENHGLLKVSGRPQWRTVDGGSREYIRRLTAAYADRVHTSRGIKHIARTADGVRVTDAAGAATQFDHVVIATHADQALTMLSDPSADESRLLGAFEYTQNLTILHSDVSLMPKRKSIWSSWNYLAQSAKTAETELCVTYWMNHLQSLPKDDPLLVTLNPIKPPRSDSIFHSELYEHPVFDEAAIRAQRKLWQLQGHRNTWFCGAYFGSGFHEDGLQSGLAVAEALGGVRRPWTVPNQSGRIHLAPPNPTPSIAA
ncbi:MAG: Amine oxidase [Rhodospirillales bacterium]|nr:Amine oxidase [Rhodospirillales bacterium]